MSLTNLLNRSKTTKSIQEQRAARIKTAVDEVMSSTSTQLTMMNHMGQNDTETQQQLQEFATAIVDKVSAAATDPVVEFMDVCKARGMKESKIEDAVKTLNDVFGFVPKDAKYEDKLAAVAEYMQANTSMYEDIVLLG